ncbi:calcium-binding protein [Sphingobium sp. OAS761]|uniref:calcium-binding protein n=1 Tax=Sphingobium sp. OAS761 TaxID=2817901 RepID=UPI00345FE5AD
MAGSNDRVTIDNGVNDWWGRIEKVSFADGTIWTFTDLMARSTIGTPGTDVIYGHDGIDQITGKAGDDILYGNNGNDRLTGGSGNDTLSGGNGIDVAVFNGEQSSYSLSTSNGSIFVTDVDAASDGDDGKDSLSSIEIAEFKNGVQSSLAAPIVLDLNGDGVQLIEKAVSEVNFDWNSDGISDPTGWIGGTDGFLFIDRDNNGTVTDGDELSFTNDKADAKSDLDGLNAFDSNGDGVLSGADDQFELFAVWRDEDGNGLAAEGEILSLANVGIASINLEGDAVNAIWRWGENVTVNTGSFVRADGSTGSFLDVALSFDMSSNPAPKLEGRISSPGDRQAKISTRNQASRLVEAIAAFDGGSGTSEFDLHDQWRDRREYAFAFGRTEMR